jgi:hypothetical protein
MDALIGFAVTCGGIPVRCWVWPGNTADSSVVEEVNQFLPKRRKSRRPCPTAGC